MNSMSNPTSLIPVNIIFLPIPNLTNQYIHYILKSNTIMKIPFATIRIFKLRKTIYNQNKHLPCHT